MSDRLLTLNRWLAGVLGRADYSLAPASEDASFRRYFRVTVGEDAGTPGSWIVMDAPPGREDCRPFVHVAGLLGATGVHVPAVIAQDLSLGLLLLDDLGHDRYLDLLDERSADRLYGDAMGALLTIQACAATEGLPGYDRGRLRDEMALFPDWLLTRHLGHAPTRAEHEVLDKTFGTLEQTALAQPQVFVHRDYHSRNLMVCRGHNPGILDFQDAVRGPLTYDLVSLLRDAYVRWPQQRVYGWARGYHDLAVQHGVLAREDEEGFVRDFDLMGVQRHIKVAGIFARLWHRDGKSSYLADIPLVLDYLLDVAVRYPELRAFHALCTRLDVRARVVEANARIAASAARGVAGA